MLNRIEKITEETRGLVNQFLIDNWFSTDISIRGEMSIGPGHFDTINPQKSKTL